MERFDLFVQAICFDTFKQAGMVGTGIYKIFNSTYFYCITYITCLRTCRHISVVDIKQPMLYCICFPLILAHSLSAQIGILESESLWI